MTNPWQEWKKKNAERQSSGIVRPWDFANPETEYCSEEEQTKRYDTCEGCDKLTVAKTCKECGCFMPAKVKLKHAKCPLNKW